MTQETETEVEVDKADLPKIRVDASNVSGISQALHMSSMDSMNPPIPIGSREELMFLSGAFGGEAGELQNVLKKIVRDGSSPELVREVAAEAADVFAYLIHILTIFKIDLGAAMVAKTSLLVNERKPDWAMKAIRSLSEAYPVEETNNDSDG